MRCNLYFCLITHFFKSFWYIPTIFSFCIQSWVAWLFSMAFFCLFGTISTILPKCFKSSFLKSHTFVTYAATFIALQFIAFVSFSLFRFPSLLYFLTHSLTYLIIIFVCFLQTKFMHFVLVRMWILLLQTFLFWNSLMFIFLLCNILQYPYLPLW